ncbi:MAG: hypothetical protein ABI629_21435, partial [bacterium]
SVAPVIQSSGLAVRNADTSPLPERPGHSIRVIVDAGSCPPSLIDGGADFYPHRRGTQDTLVLDGGRQRRAQILLSPDAAVQYGPLHCVLHVAVEGPGDDPTPHNNIVDVSVEVR